MKQLSVVFIGLILASCGSRYVVQTDSPELLPNEGYLGFMINTIDNLTNIQLKHVENNDKFYIGSAEVGNNLYLLKLQEGEYCFIGFNTYGLIVDYEDKGFCTYVEAGEVNYFSNFRVRNPLTNAFTFFDYFAEKLYEQHPEICVKYIGQKCNP